MTDTSPGIGPEQSRPGSSDSDLRTANTAAAPDEEPTTPVYPAPDQQQLWAGNPWGARLSSSADPVPQPEPYSGSAAAVDEPAPAPSPSDFPPSTEQPGNVPGGTASARATGVADRSRRTRSRPLLAGARVLTPLVLAGLALVLLLAAGVISFVVWRNAHSHHDQTAEPQATAADAVTGYLDALAAGRAVKAVGYLARKPASTALMTDSVLTASRKAAPITAIKVPAGHPNARTVVASYRVGHQAVHSTFVTHRVHGRYLIDNGFLTIDTSTWPVHLPIKINGVRVRGHRIYLLPGHYALTVQSRYLGLRGGSGFTVTGPQDVPAVALQPEVTAKGQQAFRKAVSAAVGDCLKSTKLQAGCGLTLPDTAPNGRKIIDGTVRRRLSASAKAGLQRLIAFALPTDPRKASASLGGGAVVTTATCEVKSKPAGKKTKVKRRPNSGKRCAISGSGTALATPVIDMLSSKLVVDWR